MQNAWPAGLVIILFDQLIIDLKRAIAAIEAGDIEKRSNEIKHAFLVLQQLEGSLDIENSGEAAKHFAMFYSSIRSKVLEAQIKISPEILNRQIELLFDVRQAWQQADQQASPSAPVPAPLAANPYSAKENHSASWTA